MIRSVCSSESGNSVSLCLACVELVDPDSQLCFVDGWCVGNPC